MGFDLDNLRVFPAAREFVDVIWTAERPPGPAVKRFIDLMNALRRDRTLLAQGGKDERPGGLSPPPAACAGSRT